MESRKQKTQHKAEMEGIPRIIVKRNSRSTSVQQTWRGISPDWSWRTEGSGRDAPRRQTYSNKSNDTFGIMKNCAHSAFGRYEKF
jgi:hypothetical protein